MDPVGWYAGLPRITRWYTTACAAVTGLCALDVLHPYDLYFNSRLVLWRGEWWRVPGSFLYFGGSWIEFGFQMFFLTRYARSLEEGSFHGRAGDCLWMLLLMAATIALLAPYASVQFLGPSLAFALVYLWGRRNASARLSFLGLFEFSAPYLPWVLVALSVAMGGSPAVDVLGLAAGHLFFFLDDVYPFMPGGRRLTAAPAWLARALGQPAGAAGNRAADGPPPQPPGNRRDDHPNRLLGALLEGNHGAHGAHGERRAQGTPPPPAPAPQPGHVLGRGNPQDADAPAPGERVGLFGIPLDDRAVEAAREARGEGGTVASAAGNASGNGGGASASTSAPGPAAQAPLSPRAAAREALRQRVLRGEQLPLGAEPTIRRGAPEPDLRERRRAAAALAAERRAAAAAAADAPAAEGESAAAASTTAAAEGGAAAASTAAAAEGSAAAVAAASAVPAPAAEATTQASGRTEDA